MVDAFPVMKIVETVVVAKVLLPVTVRLEMVLVAKLVEPRTAKLSVEVAPVAGFVMKVLFSTHPEPFQYKLELVAKPSLNVPEIVVQ